MDPNNRTAAKAWNLALDKAIEIAAQHLPSDLHHTPNQRGLCAACSKADAILGLKLEIR